MSRKIASKIALVGLVGLGLIAGVEMSACSTSNGTGDDTSGTAGAGNTTNGTAGARNTGTAGTGNTTNGTAGTGNTTNGTAGAGTGTAGTGSMGTGFACAGTMPTTALISSLGTLTASATNAGQYTFADGLSGGTFSYQPTVFTYVTTGGALEVKGNVANYDGFGLYFTGCTDASAYTGVSFNIMGNAGTSGMMTFSFQTNADTGIDSTNMKGTCVTADLANQYPDCHFATYTFPVTATGGVVNILFSDVTAGLPVTTVDGKDLLGLQWAFAWAGATDTAYDVDVTVSNVMFTGGTGPGLGGTGGATGTAGASSGGAGGGTAGTGGAASGGTGGAATGGTGGAATAGTGGDATAGTGGAATGGTGGAATAGTGGAATP